jgi:hypothetical protein
VRLRRFCEQDLPALSAPGQFAAPAATRP